MTRFALILPLILAAPLRAGEALPDSELRQLAADALSEAISRPGQPGQAEISRAQRDGGAALFCANTDAFNANGSFIGLDYWEIRVPVSGEGEPRLRNVTGLLSPCYGADFEPFRELRDN